MSEADNSTLRTNGGRSRRLYPKSGENLDVGIVLLYAKIYHGEIVAGPLDRL